MKNLFPALIFSLTLGNAIAQDIHFSQFNQSPMTINPALTAADCEMRGSVNYRTQWKGVTIPYKTVGASIETNLGKLAGADGEPKSSNKIAAGLSFLSDRSGDGKMGFTQANLSFASHIPLNDKMKLGAAFLGGIGQKNINYDELTWGTQYNGTAYDPTLTNGESLGNENFVYQDLGAGLFFNLGSGPIFNRSSDKFKLNAGLSVLHLNKPKMSFYKDVTKKVDMKTVFHGGFLVPLGKSRMDLAPSWMYTMQGKAKELVVGMMLKANLSEENKFSKKLNGAAISLGAFYRTGDAIIANFMLEFGTMGIGVSYDLGNADVKSASKNANALEFSIRFINPNPHKAAPEAK